MSVRTGQLDGLLAKGHSQPVPQHYATHMTEDRLALIVVGVIFSVLGLFAILCRVLALLHRQRTPGYDDYMLFVAYVFSVGFTIASYVSVAWGVGLRMSDAPASWAVRAIKAEYVIEIFYYFSLFFIKLSILFLYLRLAYELRNHLYWGTLIVLGLLGMQFASTIIVISAQCIPLKKYWDPEVSGQCVNLTGFFYATNVFTIVTDIIMLILPIPTIWKVPRPRTQKYGLLAAFLLGGLSTLASCVRLYSIRIYTESGEPMRDAAPINTWSFIEVNVALCCSSIAVMKQVIVAVRNGSISPTLTNSFKRSPSSPSTVKSSVASTLGSKKYKEANMSRQEDDFARWSRRPPSPATFFDAMEKGTTKPNAINIAGIAAWPARQSSPLPPSPARHYDGRRESVQLLQSPRSPISPADWHHDNKGDTALPQRPASSVHTPASRDTYHSCEDQPPPIPTIRVMHAFHPWEREEEGLTKDKWTPQVITTCT